MCVYIYIFCQKLDEDPALLEAKNMLLALDTLERHHRMGPTTIADAAYCGGPGHAEAGPGQPPHSRISSLCVCACVLFVY